MVNFMTSIGIYYNIIYFFIQPQNNNNKQMNKSSFFPPLFLIFFYDLTMYKEVSLHNKTINESLIKLFTKRIQILWHFYKMAILILAEAYEKFTHFNKFKIIYKNNKFKL